MDYDFDEVIDRRGTDSSKWDGGPLIIKRGYSTRFDENTIPLFTADMDFLCAPAIIEAMKQVAERGIYGYTSIVDQVYYRAIKNWFYRYNKWEFDEENIVFAHGTMSALQDVIQIFTNPNEGIIIMPPVYSGFDSTITFCGRKSVYCHLKNTDENQFIIDFEKFEKLAQDKNNKAVLICNPHNPIGRVWTEEELKTIVKISRENNLFIWSDDVHCDLVRNDKKYIPIASISDYEKIITFTSLSKTFNLAGLYVTHVIFQNSEMREVYCKRNKGDSPSPFDVAAVKAAYTKCEDWVMKLRSYLDENIRWAAEFLEENIAGVKCTRPEGSYIIWIDFEHCGKSKEEVRSLIYEKANVMLSSGIMSDPEGNGYCYRACLGASKKIISEAMIRIADVFND